MIEGISGSDCDGLPEGGSATVYRAPGASKLELRVVETAAERADLRMIYTAATAEGAERELEQFAGRWDATHPTISQIWRRNWNHVTPFFAFPPEIRKVIYTTN